MTSASAATPATTFLYRSGLKKAGDVKDKFGVRVVASCPGCWMELREDQVAFLPVTPTYLPVQAGTGTKDGPSKRLISTAPDSNEPFLSRRTR
jgi:hypothetical protein